MDRQMEMDILKWILPIPYADLKRFFKAQKDKKLVSQSVLMAVWSLLAQATSLLD